MNVNIHKQARFAIVGGKRWGVIDADRVSRAAASAAIGGKAIAAGLDGNLVARQLGRAWTQGSQEVCSLGLLVGAGAWRQKVSNEPS